MGGNGGEGGGVGEGGGGGVGGGGVRGGGGDGGEARGGEGAVEQGGGGGAGPGGAVRHARGAAAAGGQLAGHRDVRRPRLRRREQGADAAHLRRRAPRRVRDVAARPDHGWFPSLSLGFWCLFVVLYRVVRRVVFILAISVRCRLAILAGGV